MFCAGNVRNYPKESKHPIGWQPFPVISLDLDLPFRYDTEAENRTRVSGAVFASALSKRLDAIADEYEVEWEQGVGACVDGPSIGKKIGILVDALSRRSENGKVVVLVDNYDQPVAKPLWAGLGLERAEAEGEARASLSVLSCFFAALNEKDDKLQVGFARGVVFFGGIRFVHASSHRLLVFRSSSLPRAPPVSRPLHYRQTSLISPATTAAVRAQRRRPRSARRLRRGGSFSG